jgi:DNA polymerase (family 10)
MKKNAELAGMFDRIADALEYKGELAFKVIAYRKAARALEELTDDIELLAKQGKLRTIPGVGEGIAKKIDEYLATGKMKKFEEAMAEIPSGLLELLSVQNLGPKTLALAHQELGVNNREDLKRVIDNGSLARLFRMGEKKVENIKKGLEIFGKAQERISIAQALRTAEEVVTYLKGLAGVRQVEPSGSLRRMKETIGDIDILVTGKNGTKIIEGFTRYPRASRVLASGETKSSIMVGSGKNALQVDIRVVPASSFGAALQYFTGSKEHNVKLRSMARERGLKISEYGVFKGEKRIAGRTEEEVYKTLGLPWIPPELRENRGEIERALAGKLPVIVDYSDIRGDLHVHSRYSDGVSTIAEIADQAKALGYNYVAICDHSQSVHYAGGLSEDKLKRQMDEIDTLNEKIKGITILKGTEVDILKSGKLDFPDKLLEQLDVVVAAIHQSFKEKVTERISAALSNPNVDIIAHPTGRVISRREGYVVDIEKVFEKAREYGKALELNAYYDRLDLNELYLRKAKEAGIKISIGSDAHGALDLHWMRFGIGIARRGWLEKDDVLNTLSYKELKKTLTVK